MTLKEQFKKLLDSDNSNDALIEFQDAVNEFPMKIQTAHRKATQESTTLKVLGSPKLFALTNKFEDAHQEILELSAEWLTEMKQAFTMPDFESLIAIQMKNKGKEIGFLQKEIIKQMRVELKLEQ